MYPNGNDVIRYTQSLLDEDATLPCNRRPPEVRYDGNDSGDGFGQTYVTATIPDNALLN